MIMHTISDLAGIKTKILVSGDDALVMMEQSDIPKFTRQLEDFIQDTCY